MTTTQNLNHYVSQTQNAKLISDRTYGSLLENCFCILSGKPEIHNMNTLYASKPDVIKEFYAFLLSVTSEFVRQNHSKEEIKHFLETSCKLPPARVVTYLDQFERNKRDIEVSLLNIGSYLPHVVDTKWKIDYIVKSNMVDQPDGPLFRICLMAEEYNQETESKKLSHINFTCTTQEMQDLVYKLKDAVRHCNSVMQRIL